MDEGLQSLHTQKQRLLLSAIFPNRICSDLFRKKGAAGDKRSVSCLSR